MRPTVLALIFALMFPLGVLADALPAPSGPVVLTVSGAIGETNVGAVAAFDLGGLDRLAQGETVTVTPWFEGERSFSGPLVSALLEAVGATGTRLRVIAINDYAVEIPVSDMTDYPVILATRMGGRELSVREKGPAFVIYPFDRFPELYDERYFGRSVWQVRAIEVF